MSWKMWSRRATIALVAGLLAALAVGSMVVSAQAVTGPASIGGVRPADVAISGDRVVWADRAAGNWDIYVFDASTGVTTQLTTNTSDQIQPSISGDIVVWVDYRDGDADIWMHDFFTGNTSQLVAAVNDQVRPSISGRWVVWEDYRTGYNPGIYGTDVAAPTPGGFKISSGYNQPRKRPVVAGDLVVWEDYSGQATGRMDADVRGADLSTLVFGSPFEPTMTYLDVAVTAGVPEMMPWTDGRYVVWSRDEDGDPDIFGFDKSDGSTFAVLEQEGEQTAPVASGGVAYWIDNSGGKRLHVDQRDLAAGGAAKPFHTYGSSDVVGFVASGKNAAWLEPKGVGWRVRAVFNETGASGLLSFARTLPERMSWIPARLARLTTSFDEVAPTIVSSSVQPGQTEVAADEPIAVYVSENLDAATVNPGTVSLMDDATGETVPADIRYSALAGAISVAPFEPLGDGSFTLTVGGTVTDVAGNSLGEDTVTTFSTTTFFAGDTVKPSMPGLIDARVVGLFDVMLTWKPSTDNVGVTGYRVYRLWTPITESNITSASVETFGPFASTATTALVSVAGDELTNRKYTYYYAVRATDADGNWSDVSLNMTPNPHGTYDSVTFRTRNCQMCHAVHGTVAPGRGALNAKSAEACYTCHGDTETSSLYGYGSTIDVEYRFFGDASRPLPAGGTRHYNSYQQSLQGECDSCHTPHRRPATVNQVGTKDNAASYSKLLKRPVNPSSGATGSAALVYSTDASPFNETFCFSCHGTQTAYMNSRGGTTAYSNAAGDHETGYSASAHATSTVLANLRVGSNPGPSVNCGACHNTHASATRKLVDYRNSDTSTASYNLSGLCFTCHKTGSTENRVTGSSAPFSWNGRALQTEFGRTSAHPNQISTGPVPVPTPWTSLYQTTAVEFAVNTLFQTVTQTVDDGEVVLEQYTTTIDPPPFQVLYGHNGPNSSTFDEYTPGAAGWNSDFNPANNNLAWNPATGSSGFYINDRFYMTRGGGQTSQGVYNPATNSWSNGQALPTAVGVGGDSTVNTRTADTVIYYNAGGSNSKIMWWNYTNTTTGQFDFRDNGGTNRNLGVGSSIAFAPDANRLFVIYNDNFSGDGRLYWRAGPARSTTTSNFSQGIQVVRSGSGRYARMAYFKKAGVEYLFIIGRDTGDANDSMVMTTLGGTPAKIELADGGPFNATLGDGADLEWDGGDYLYATRGGANNGFARIQIPANPSQATNWGAWESLPNPSFTWGSGSSIGVGMYDPPPAPGLAYRASGTVTTSDILPHASAYKWGTLNWTEVEPAQTTLRVTVQWRSGTGSWANVPGFVDIASGPVDLSSLTVASYPKLRLIGTLSTTDNLATPRLDDWTVTSIYDVMTTLPSTTCANCHNAHTAQKGGASAWQVSRVANPDNVKQSASSITDFCLKCHDASAPSATLSASTLVPYSVSFRSVSGYPYFPGWDKAASGLEFVNSGHYTATTANGKALCQNCHDPHGSDNPRLTAWTLPSGVTWSGGFSIAGSRVNTTTASLEENLCYKCHGNGTASYPKANGAPNVYTPMSQTNGHGSTMTGNSRRHSDFETAAGVSSDNRHVECVDCHDPHAARAGLHTAGQGTAGPAVRGAVGVKYSTTNGNWGVPSGWSSERLDGGATDYEAYLCFKCHSGNTTLPGSATDIAQQFNTANHSGHNVTGNVWPKTTTAQGLYGNAPFPSGTNGTFRSGWDQNSMVTCSDCHTGQTGNARGPHGSSVAKLIDSAYTASYATAQLVSGDTYGMTANVICSKCHDLNGSTNNTWGNNAHDEHKGRNGANRCVQCHISVPHGWKRPRLLGYTDDPAPYATEAGSLWAIRQDGLPSSSTGWTQTGDCMIPSSGGCYDAYHGNDWGVANRYP